MKEHVERVFKVMWLSGVELQWYKQVQPHPLCEVQPFLWRPDMMSVKREYAVKMRQFSWFIRIISGHHHKNGKTELYFIKNLGGVATLVFYLLNHTER